MSYKANRFNRDLNNRQLGDWDNYSGRTRGSTRVGDTGLGSLSPRSRYNSDLNADLGDNLSERAGRLSPRNRYLGNSGRQYTAPGVLDLETIEGSRGGRGRNFLRDLDKSRSSRGHYVPPGVQELEAIGSSRVGRGRNFSKGLRDHESLYAGGHYVPPGVKDLEAIEGSRGSRLASRYRGNF